MLQVIASLRITDILSIGELLQLGNGQRIAGIEGQRVDGHGRKAQLKSLRVGTAYLSADVVLSTVNGGLAQVLHHIVLYNIEGGEVGLQAIAEGDMRTHLELVAIDGFEDAAIHISIQPLSAIVNVDIAIADGCTCGLEEAAGRGIDVDVVVELIERAQTIGQRIVVLAGLRILAGNLLMLAVDHLVVTMEVVVAGTGQQGELRCQVQIVGHLQAVGLLPLKAAFLEGNVDMPLVELRVAHVKNGILAWAGSCRTIAAAPTGQIQVGIIGSEEQVVLHLARLGLSVQFQLVL